MQRFSRLVQEFPSQNNVTVDRSLTLLISILPIQRVQYRGDLIRKMSPPKRKTSILFLLWPVSLIAAFLIGRFTNSTDIPTSYRPNILESVEEAPRPAGKILAQAGDNDAQPEDSMIKGDGEIDPLLQMRNAIAESNALKRMSLLTDAFSRLNKDNIEEALALYEMLPDSNAKRQMYSLLLNTWGKLDGPAAMEYVMANSDQGGGRGRGGGGRFGGGGTRDSMAVMSGWAETDPKSAVLWAQNNSAEERGRNTLMLAAMQGWANNDIRGALDFAITQESADGNGRGPGMEGFLINRFVNENRQAATQWALSQSDPSARNEAVSSVAQSMANENPQEAALWAQSLSDPASQAEALKGTASGWVRENPTEAMDWAMSLEDPETSSEVVQSALNTWVRTDPYTAAEYVLTMESGETKDSAAATLSKGLSRQDPEMAALWVETITDPQLQAETALSVYDSWTRRRPEQASEWIETSNLPDETKESILKPRKTE